jgi:hypothetical protein
MKELSVIQKTYDLICWYVPILNRMPRSHKFTLGDRMINGMYDLLDGLITARYAKDRIGLLEPLNTKLDILRYQTRLLLQFTIIDAHRYKYASNLLNDVGTELGGWIKQQKKKDLVVE